MNPPARSVPGQADPYNLPQLVHRTLLALLVALSVSPLAARSFGDFDVAPPPVWVRDVELDYAAATPSSRYGVFDLLGDHQVRVTADGSSENYYRVARKLLSAAGVQNASELTIAFDPSYQRLVLHSAVIVRNGRRIDALNPDEVRVIEAEENSEENIYAGQLNALIVLKDVRPGDVLDYAWTVDGANPILRGHYADDLDLSSSVPAGLIRHRLLWPADRPIHFKGHAQPTIEALGREKVLTWERHNVPALDLEDDTPSWYEPWQSVQVTDFESWNEVAQWAEDLFAVTEDSESAVAALAERLRGQKDPVTAAIRFVQDDIRYLGIEIGRNSHEPRQPSLILEQRWGDCKEKSLLLAMLLRELGLDAEPALVSTRLRHRLDQRLPSPFAFDHVIVRVTEGSVTYWVDPTLSQQGGTLETIDTPDDGRALLVSSEATSLIPIKTRHAGRTVVEETYVSQSVDQPTELQVKTTLSGADADHTRARLADASLQSFAREQMNLRAADHPAISSAAPPTITDNRITNTIVITERYAIRDLWKSGKWTFHPRAIESHLGKPATVIRSMPLAVEHPLDVTHRATFIFPRGVRIAPREIAHSTPALRLAGRVRTEGKRLVAEYTLRSVADSVPASKVAAHLSAFNEIDRDLDLTVEPQFEKNALANATAGSRTFFWAIGAVFLLAAVVMSLRKLSLS